MSTDNQKALPKWLLFLKKIMEIIIEILNNLPQDPTPAEQKACEACIANLLSISKELHYELGDAKPGAHD